MLWKLDKRVHECMLCVVSQFVCAPPMWFLNKSCITLIPWLSVFVIWCRLRKVDCWPLVSLFTFVMSLSCSSTLWIKGIISYNQGGVSDVAENTVPVSFIKFLDCWFWNNVIVCNFAKVSHVFFVRSCKGFLCNLCKRFLTESGFEPRATMDHGPRRGPKLFLYNP